MGTGRTCVRWIPQNKVYYINSINCLTEITEGPSLEFRWCLTEIMTEYLYGFMF